jgi:phosphoglycerate dehydrogenase-like enzyme
MTAPRPVVYVSHHVDEPVRAAYRGSLSPWADVVFGTDLGEQGRLQAIARARVLACFSPIHELSDAAICEVAHLSLVQCLAAGRDRFPFERFARRTLVAFNPGAAAGPIAEHAVALLLAAAKNLLPRHHALAQGRFEQSAKNTRLHGRTAAVIGLGAIGTRVTVLLQALGVGVRAVNRSGSTRLPVQRCCRLDELDAALADADIAVVCIALNAETLGRIGRRELALLRPDAILVNVSRAAVVQQDALFEHLSAHPQFRAGLDVWWDEPMHGGAFRLGHPFFDLPNVVGSPHNSPMVDGIMTDLALAAAANIARHLRGEPPQHVATSAM